MKKLISLFILCLTVCNFTFARTITITITDEEESLIPVDHNATTKREILDWYTDLKTFEITTTDKEILYISLCIGFSRKNSEATYGEISQKQTDIEEIISTYLSSKTSSELTIMQYEDLRNELINQINQILQNKISDIQFLEGI